MGREISIVTLLAGLASAFVGASVVESAVQGTPAWPRVEIEDPVTREAVVTALNGATAWLESQGCLSLFDELRDDEGRPLMDSLRQWKLAPIDYLRMVWFLDGERHRVCRSGRVLAFTARHGRVVFLCGRRFARAAARDPLEARATVIHELLHTLGLGENPPSPRYITDRVKRRCWSGAAGADRAAGLQARWLSPMAAGAIPPIDAGNTAASPGIGKENELELALARPQQKRHGTGQDHRDREQSARRAASSRARPYWSHQKLW